MRAVITESDSECNPSLKQQLLTSFSHIIPHVDKLRARHAVRINNEDVQFLINNSTNVTPNLRVKNCNDRLVWVTHITNPNKEAAKLLQHKYAAVLSYLEGAINLISKKPKALTKEAAESVVLKNFRKSHDIVFHENVIYFMQRKKNGKYRRGRVFCVYGDRLCKVTGKACCHMEERLSGIQAIAREGIMSILDALNFDWIGHFQKRLKFCKVDFEELGIVYRKRMKRKGITIEGEPEQIGRELFERLGKVRNGGREGLFIQELVKKIGRNRALREIPVLSNISNPLNSTTSRKNGKVVHIRNHCIRRVRRIRPKLVRVKRLKLAA